MKKSKMNPMLIGAIALGLLSLFLIYYLVTSMQASMKGDFESQLARMREEMANKQGGEVVIKEKAETHPVVYAVQAIPANTRIDSVYLEVKETPMDLHEDGFTDINEVVDKFAARNLNPGEALTPTNVEAERITMSERLTPGKRAFALAVITEQDSTGGFVVDGDYVDLILSYPLSKDQVAVITAMQNVKVLYIPGPSLPRTDATAGLAPNPPAGSAVAVTTTFEVTPEQAEELIALSQMGTLRMVLRNRDDDIEVRTQGTSTIAIRQNPALSNQRSKRSERKASEVLQEIKAKTELEVQNKDRNAQPTPQP